ncbi:MAG: T9SS C-terminal target domain-containing protein, partial [Ignavibacteriales bacterium]
MQNAQYRNLYTHFLEFYRTNVYQLSIWENKINSLRSMIAQSALSDSFRTLDYGFDTNDFFNSYNESGYSNQHVKYGIKEFVNLKNSQLPGLLSYLSAKPIAYKIEYEPKNPGPNDSIYVFASAFDNDGLSEVSIHFQANGSSTTQIYQMNYSPVSNTKNVDEADRWIGIIPPLGAGNSGKFFVFVKDNQNQSQFYPRKKAIDIRASQIITNEIVINEFMADNGITIADPNGEYDDWIELYNPTSSPINLTGRYLTDKKDNLIKYQFTQPNLVLNPNEYLLIWCDEQQEQQGIHTNFKLSASGEFIALVENDAITVIDSISFGPQTTDISFGRLPDGADNWITMTPTPGTTNNLVSVEDEGFIPNEFSLSAYPNPFNPSTSIRYSIPNVTLSLVEGSRVQLIIYDVLGNQITTLVNEEKPSGTYEVIWNGKNDSGNNVSSGIYFVRIQANQQFKNLKLMLLK